jgi:hypothetical protein
MSGAPTKTSAVTSFDMVETKTNCSDGQALVLRNAANEHEQGHVPNRALHRLKYLDSDNLHSHEHINAKYIRINNKTGPFGKEGESRVDRREQRTKDEAVSRPLSDMKQYNSPYMNGCRKLLTPRVHSHVK